MLENVIKIIIFQIIISFPIIYLSKKRGLLDMPDKRKFHKMPIPYSGGIIISLTYLFIIYLMNFKDSLFIIILTYGFIISLTGLIDDKYNVRPGTKLVLQSLPIFFLIDQNLYLVDLGTYKLLGDLSLGSFDKIFTLLACLLLINAFNYNDGLDGLLSSISIIILLTFSFFIFLIKNIFFIEINIILIPVVVFLCFNLGIIKNYKVFLGDSGSNLLGFVIAFISIYLYNQIGLHPALIVWPLAYTVYEFLSVTFLRILNNRETFKSGRDHLHYELLYLLNLKPLMAVFIILIINLFYILLGLNIFFKLGEDQSIFLFVTLFLFHLSAKYYLSNKLSSKGH